MINLPSVIFTARVAKRAKVMFSQASVCPTRGEERTTPYLLSRVKGHNVPLDNTSSPGQHLPLCRVKGHKTSPLDNTSLPPSRVKGHNTYPSPLDNTFLPWTTPAPPPLFRVKGRNTFPRTMCRRAVCILLECILVPLGVSKGHHRCAFPQPKSPRFPTPHGSKFFHFQAVFGQHFAK